jgi:hypothetical protein
MHAHSAIQSSYSSLWQARVTLKPLVDVIPCIGGVSISLLRVPHVDLSLSMVGGVDLMVGGGLWDLSDNM